MDVAPIPPEPSEPPVLRNGNVSLVIAIALLVLVGALVALLFKAYKNRSKSHS